ncbi:hypothetical protein AB0L00_41495 [Actinoallomurus sp. NPDC052308]|uniref:hypothetical protein n=1 Tax=Actinoallomurus sp. NPDC052308 TaxID=3155530 RepID=UPI0034277290
MRISKTKGVGATLAAMTITGLAWASSPSAQAGVLWRAGGICQSVAGINAYAQQNGFTPRYVAEMCNRNAGTHWNVTDFSG